jgi:hypothetical protein
MAVRYFTLIMGVLFILAGIGGFIFPVTQPIPALAPALTLDASYGLLLGLFPINLVHNLVHLSFGIWGVWAWRTDSHSRTYCRAMAIILSLFALMGLLPITQLTFGLMPLFGHDIWLHALEAIVAAYLGYWYVSASTPSPLIQASR